MLLLPVFRSLGECGHPAEMLVGLLLCHQTSRAPDWPKRPARPLSTLRMAKPLRQPLAFSWLVPLCPQCVEKSRCVGQEDQESASNKTSPSVSSGARHPPWVRTLCICFSCQTPLCTGIQRRCLWSTQHTLCTEGLPVWEIELDILPHSLVLY